MLKLIGFMCLCLIFVPLNAGADSFRGDGTIDNSSGTTNSDLVYRGFQITPDGYITGFIVNTSNHALKSVRLDVWTTNRAETRIYWRKSISIGDMAPKSQFEVKEVYGKLQDEPESIIFKFRVPGGTNFRNK